MSANAVLISEAASGPAWTPAARRNLPTPATPLVGRGREIAAASALLRSTAGARLLTLTGPGGVGKTRLALQVAAETDGVFADGVVFVALAPLGDPTLVMHAVAQALGLRETDAGPLGAAEHLRDWSLLLVLDNFEHVLPAAPEVGVLLAACAGLKVLVTSRAPLHLAGEQEFPVPPLALPDLARVPAPEALAQVEAVELFLRRATAVKPDFRITAQNAPALATLCHRLDGLPLAIELAAAWIKVLAPLTLLARLGSHLLLIPWAAHDGPERHQTLRHVIDWSHDLLEPAERRLFARLGVFSGGWTLEAAEAVAEVGDSGPGAEGAAEPDTGIGPEAPDRVPHLLSGLAALVDKSLVQSEEDAAGGTRFTLLETVRAYALERLQASGEAEAIRGRHAAYFLALAERAEPELLGPQQVEWQARLEREHGNLRAALAWSLQHGPPEAGLRLAGSLWRFWRNQYLTEGLRWLESALGRSGQAPGSLRAKACAGAGTLAFLRGDPEAARAWHEAALAGYREVGDQRGIAFAVFSLGAAVLNQGDHGRAAAILTESLSLFRAIGDRWGIGESLLGLGEVARCQGDFGQAAAHFEVGLASLRELGDGTEIAVCAHNLAHALLRRGDRRRAVLLFREALSLFQELTTQWGIGWCLAGLAGVAGAAGQPARAARLFGAAEALLEAAGAPLQTTDRTDFDHHVAVARAQLDGPAFAAAWAAGRALPLGEAIAEALTPIEPPAPASPQGAGKSSAGPAAPLTRREREVAALVARAYTNREIAEALVIAEGTTERHVANIFTKLDLTARAQLITWAIRHGLADSRPT